MPTVSFTPFNCAGSLACAFVVSCAATRGAIDAGGADSPFSVTAQADDADANVALGFPAMLGTLAGNPRPMGVHVGSLGPVYVTGAATALGRLGTHEATSEESAQWDLSNAQVFVQKPTGMLQFFARAGAYSLPALGTTYVRSRSAAAAFYGTMPTAFVKFAPSDDVSILAGKLPTLLGAECTFTFENVNIERGLLWNQENAIARGVQANATAGPLSFALSLNDGFYSDEYTWITGALTYTLDSGDSLCLYGGGNTDEDATSTLATPLAQNNSRILGLICSYAVGPWELTPYVQYTDVPENPSIGIADDASTLGAAVLVRCAFDDHFSLASRVEFLESDGSAASPNLLYGPQSSAWSLTVTPTWQWGSFFVRVEASYVEARDAASGSAFGSAANDRSQARGLIELGLLF